MTHLPTELYASIHANMPIPCIDTVIVHDNQVLLAKRTNKPAKGQWWFPGGRIHKSETLTEAVQRKMLEEIGQRVNIIKMLGADETMFPDGPFGGPTHSINIVFLATPSHPSTLSLADQQHNDLAWFDHPREDLDKYIKKFMTLALVELGTHQNNR